MFVMHRVEKEEGRPTLNVEVHDEFFAPPHQECDELPAANVVLPGLDKNHIEIVVIDGDLTVHSQQVQRAGANSQASIGALGEWVLWRMLLPPGSDADSIQSVCQDDVLTVVVPTKPLFAGDAAALPVRIEEQTFTAPTHTSSQS